MSKIESFAIKFEVEKSKAKRLMIYGKRKWRRC